MKKKNFNCLNCGEATFKWGLCPHCIIAGMVICSCCKEAVDYLDTVRDSSNNIICEHCAIEFKDVLND